MSNYSILQQNTFAGLSEFGGALYLRLLDVFQGHTKEGERRAFFAADQYERGCGGVLDYILDNAPLPYLSPQVKAELADFFAARWQNNFMGEIA